MIETPQHDNETGEAVEAWLYICVHPGDCCGTMAAVLERVTWAGRECVDVFGDSCPVCGYAMQRL